MRRTCFAPALVAALAAVIAAAPAPATASEACTDFDATQTFGFDYRSGDAARRVVLDETREIPLAAPRGEWAIEGAENGAISVSAWERDRVLVCAKVVAAARDRETAAALLRGVRLVADARGLRVEGPAQGQERRWAVAVHVFAPKSMDFRVESRNGPITVVGMRGRTSLESENGPITVSDVGGSLRGGTTNGPIELGLTGPRWDGEGVDLHTTNGPVVVSVPHGYSAELDAETMNGPFEIGFPVTVQGRVRHALRTTLGSGGSVIRVRSVNGPVSIRRGE